MNARFIDALYYIAVILAFVILARLLTSCAITRDPSGAWNFALDAEQAAKAIIIYADK